MKTTLTNQKEEGNNSEHSHYSHHSQEDCTDDHHKLTMQKIDKSKTILPKVRMQAQIVKSKQAQKMLDSMGEAMK